MRFRRFPVLFFAWTPDNEQFSDVLHRGCPQLFADLGKILFADVAVVFEHPNLYQFMAFEADIDLAQNRIGKPVLADGYDGIEAVGSGAQGAALLGCDLDHADGSFKTAFRSAHSTGLTP